MWQLILALAIGGWPGIARLVRGETIRVRQQEFVQAARSIGVAEWRIMVFHILPNIFPALIVLVTLDFAVIILVEAALSFLGLGIQPPMPSLGTMISDGRNYLYNAPWITLGPGICIMLTAIGINFFGDFLRDNYDPRLAGR
jgi:ABC-type dipeptide/oligopeptide/nickel transport system permease subunit